jgi:hypothetical protein
MRKITLLAAFLIASFLTELNAQELSKVYLDSVKSFFTSRPLIDWVKTINPGIRNSTPAIVLHPCGSSNTASAKKFFSKKSNSIVYHWAQMKKYGAAKDSQLTKVDSLILSEKEKNEIIENLIGKPAAKFIWTNEYFPGASFPIRYADSLFNLTNDTDHYSNGVYFISLPTFLRNYSFCIFNYAWIIHGGGRTGFEVYKKVNDHWWKFGEFGGGDF